MNLRKIPKPGPGNDSMIVLEMHPDEYGQMCDFMIKNGVGYGPGRDLCVKWRRARDELKQRDKKEKEVVK